jgi:hypothetical protein
MRLTRADLQCGYPFFILNEVKDLSSSELPAAMPSAPDASKGARC